MTDDFELPTAPRKHTRGTIRTQLYGYLAVRGITGITPQDRVKFATVEEALDRDIALSPNGDHFVVLSSGHPVHELSAERALEKLANALAVQLGGDATAMPKTLEEVVAKQRASGIYGF